MLSGRTNLQENPRVVDHFRSIDTNYCGEFKSQIRAVEVASKGERYLFTLADEAWCCKMSGHTLWGVVMPLNEGWKRVVGRTERFGVGREVEEALRLFRPFSSGESSQNQAEVPFAGMSNTFVAIRKLTNIGFRILYLKSPENPPRFRTVPMVM